MSNYKIYCLTNNITNKKYIGVTKQKLYKRFRGGHGYDLGSKIRNAIVEYGWKNFKHEVLFETENRELAGEMEKFFIKFYDTTKKGYNNATGGFKGYTQTVSEKQRNNMSLASKGKHYSPSTEFKKGYVSEYTQNIMVPVICIETGVIYESIMKAERDLNISHHVWDCIKGKRAKCGGYHWKRVGGVENGNNN